jgi:DNA-binding transcriptional ArsR family regulator
MSLAEEARNVRYRITERLRELEPLVREYEELKRVAAEMGIETGDIAPVPQRPRARPRSRSAGRTGKGRSVPEPSPPSGDLAERVLRAVRSQPGKTVGEYAESLGVSQTTLYRPVRELTNDGAIVKRARQLFPE